MGASVVFKVLQLAILMIFKIILHFLTSSIISADKGQLFPCVIWFVFQCCISWINNLYDTVHWAQFIGINICFIYFMVKPFKGIKSKKKLIFIMGITELFWLYHCNDISCIAAYIFVFEGCFVQRIKEEYSECQLWTDRHFLCFAAAKIVFISWIYISLNWIISLCELLYFVIPTLSLKYKPFNLSL